MAVFSPFIFFFAFIAVVHLVLVTGQNEATPAPVNKSTCSLCEKYINGSTVIVGMGIVKSHIYLADNRLNVYRTDASKFSISGSGSKAKAYLDLNGAEEFSFKSQFPLKKGDADYMWLVNHLSVFFIDSPGADDPVFPTDSLCFITNNDLLTVLTLDGTFTKTLFSVSLKIMPAPNVMSNTYTYHMLSSGAQPVVFYPYVQADHVKFQVGTAKGTLIANQTKFIEAKVEGEVRDVFTGGLYLKDTKTAVLFTTLRQVILFSGDKLILSNVAGTPYANFFNDKAPPGADGLEGQLQLPLLYLVGIGGALLGLLLLFCCCVCSAGGKGSSKSKTGGRKKGGGGGGGGNVTSRSTNQAGSTSENTTASGALSGAGPTSTTAAPASGKKSLPLRSKASAPGKVKG